DLVKTSGRKRNKERKMNYICETQKQGGKGLCHCCQNTGRASSPTSVYPKTKAASDCPLLSEDVNLFSLSILKMTTLLGMSFGCVNFYSKQ
ncbi:hypothetical protein, partial [Parabacteroides sp. PF5-9]|uniref:hypothetical protein n=1 Tax=Parabacteroides sp. PF5-9 TaxID=1742404 RepID=UPI002474E045